MNNIKGVNAHLTFFAHGWRNAWLGNPPQVLLFALEQNRWKGNARDCYERHDMLAGYAGYYHCVDKHRRGELV